MPIGRIAAGVVAVLCLTLTSAYAAGQDKKPPKTHTAPKAKAHKTARAHTAPRAHTARRAHTAHAHTAPHGINGPRPLANPSVNPVATSIGRRPDVVARIGPMLPRGTTLTSAADGFRNDNQFLAALHASQNLGIPFVTLKNAVTGPNAVNLGTAIHTMRPSANPSVEVQRAELQATSDLRR